MTHQRLNRPRIDPSICTRVKIATSKFTHESFCSFLYTYSPSSHIAALFLHILCYERGYTFLEFLVVFYASLVPPLSFYMLLKNVLLSQSQKYGILLPSQVTTFSSCMFFVPLRIVYLTSRICFLFCSFSSVCSIGVDSCFYTCISLYSLLWSDTHNVLHRSLFTSRFVVGTYCQLFTYAYKLLLPFFFLFFFIIYLFQVMSVKAIGIALKLTLSGTNQLVYPQTWAFTFIVLLCVITQMNYLNKVTTAIIFRFNHLILEGKLNWLFI